MRENRTCGSEGGEAKAFPTPIRASCPWLWRRRLRLLVLTAEEGDLFQRFLSNQTPQNRTSCS